MRRHISRFGPEAWLACGFLIWLMAITTARASGPPGVNPVTAVKISAATAEFSQVQQTQQPQVPAPTAATYVNDVEVCVFCHESNGEGYAKSAHHFVSDPRTPAAKQNCETCHGPGKLHADADDPATVPMIDLEKLPPDEANTLCTSCHKTSEHVLWQGSQHEARGVACISCHSQHSAGSETKLLKGRTQMETCGACHRDKIAKLDRSGHMPVREGKMECSTCHNPHGSTNVKLLRVGDSVGELCTSCHADKRGPFLWEHAPARDGCVSCHDPHGSSNERMLVARPPILCQRCHVATRHPSTIYDAGLLQTNLHVYARSCVTCHANIHGSNHPGGSRFVR